MATLKCYTCLLKIQSHACNITCCICTEVYHLKCITLDKEDQQFYLSISNEWMCSNCHIDLFPFNCIDETDEYLQYTCPELYPIAMSDYLFCPFDLNEQNTNLPIYESDPDIHFYDNLNINGRCQYYIEESFNKELSTSNIHAGITLSIIHANMRSVQKNLSDFENYFKLLHHSFSVIAISETWLHDYNKELYCIDGYAMIQRCRSGRIGGGVALCIKDGISYNVRNDLSIFNDIMESLFIEIPSTEFNLERSVIIAVIYRPPNTDLEMFNNEIQDVLNKIHKEKKLCYLSGDFNIDLLKSEKHNLTSAFLSLMYSHSLVPLITRPTRIGKDTASLIDNIFTNNLVALQTSFQGVLTTDISDHYPVFHINPSFVRTENESFCVKRMMNETNRKKFIDSVASADWSNIFESNDAQESFTKLHTKLLFFYEQAFPKKRVKIRYNNKKPWLTDGLRKSIKMKNKLYVKSKRCPSAQNTSYYKNYRNKLCRLLRKAEKRHYNELIERNKNNLKMTWNIIKEIINKRKKQNCQTKFKLSNNQIISDKTMISEKFNDYFVNVGPTLSQSLQNVSRTPRSYLKFPMTNTIFLCDVTDTELFDIFKSLKDSAPGYDEMKLFPLKSALEYFVYPLSYVCNLSMQQGVFPQELKIANVVPLYKKDDSMVFSNYRPVSLLTSLSKVFEKVMYNRLISFLNKYKILYKYQFGFRKDHSTYLALMCLMDKLIKCLENGEHVVGVFLDFSKAFDTVDHDILMTKLYHYGIRDNALNWFKSYLSNREQFVTYNKSKSSMKTIKCGVPQGSILGPVLFLLYINDLSTLCDKVFSIFFADDSNLFKSDKNLSVIEEVLNSELEQISMWLKANKLYMNVSKTQYMIFSGRRAVELSFDLHIEGNKLNCVDKSKFLGVIIDNKLSWKDHVSYIAMKVSKGIGIVTKARHFLSHKSLLSLYYSFVYPHISYCNHIWGNAAATYINRLTVLQKRVIRIITGVPPRTPSAPLYAKLKVLNLIQMNKFLIGQLMFKYYQNKLPDVISNLFTPNREIHAHNTRQSNCLHPPKVKTELSKRSVDYQGVILWNQIISTNVSLNVSHLTFKNHLRKIILEEKI